MTCRRARSPRRRANEAALSALEWPCFARCSRSAVVRARARSFRCDARGGCDPAGAAPDVAFRFGVSVRAAAGNQTPAPHKAGDFRSGFKRPAGQLVASGASYRMRCTRRFVMPSAVCVGSRLASAPPTGRRERRARVSSICRVR